MIGAQQLSLPNSVYETTLDGMNKITADDDELVRRAFAAYFRAGASVSQPSGASHVAVHNGKLYVVLHNSGGILAVYRVRNNGALKGLRRWPAALEVW
jgi:hypothetical protein